MLRLNLRKLFLFLGDVALLYLALLATVFFGFWPYFVWQLFLEHLLPFTILYLLWLIVFYIFDLYALSVIKSRLNFYPRILAALSINFILGIIFFYGLPFFEITPKTNLILNVLISGVLFVVWRLVFWSLSGKYFSSNLFIIASEPLLGNLKKEILQRPYLGYKLLEPDLSKSLFAQIQEKNVETIILAEEFETEPNVLGALYLSLPEKVRFLDIPQAYEIISQKVPLSCLSQGWILENIKSEEKVVYEKIKQFLDFFLALFFFLLSLPLWTLIALAIKAEDGGPVFYKQKRVGKDGREFWLFKFRSMVSEAEKKGPQWAEKEDERITKLGKLLRRFHLDELPQMLNIMSGDLSLVGPRPERPEFVQELAREIPYYNLRHSVKPGFTGWAQIKFHYARSIADSREKLAYELYYLKNRSLILDCGILLKTCQLFFQKET